MIIAIDGPAGSGKSSTARALANAVNGFYLDTGAMYRAMGLAFERTDTPASAAGAASLVDSVRIDLSLEDGDMRVFLDGEDVTKEIRSPAATKAASLVSQLPDVRAKLVSEQRRVAAALSDEGHSVIVEGRDIGTVVFPDAEAKFFMDASAETRAERRRLELLDQGQKVELVDVLEDIRQRDRQDQEREHSPLRKADDAILIDTTLLSPTEQLDMMRRSVMKRIGKDNRRDSNEAS
ncbi:MAG: (d)CMP kinase [Rhodothermales bacterium]|nr:(d)CMP kinase [Rhodothermales bacterium]